jgi:hypothetical protein
MQSLNINTALHYMKSKTAKGETFSLVYYTYDRSTMKASGFRKIAKAKLRPQAKTDQVVNAKHKLFFYDYEDSLPKTCWIPLIAYIDDFKIKL